LKHLNSFHFGNDINKYITDESLIAISKNCLNLKVLYVCCFSKITDIGFNALLTKTLKNLTELYFRFCNNLKDSNVIEMSKYFLNLQVFCIIFNYNITDQSIIAITKNCKNLNKLYVENCEHITNIGFESIANHCFKLKYLNICNHYNNNITESCIKKIIKNCLKLKELNIDIGLKNTSDYFFKNLKKQNVFMNIN
jgi:F-box/leucine-rich repeat protein 2/20